jgi:hypothetical protein
MALDGRDRSSAKVAQAIRGRGGRSPLYVWMWENYAELSAARVPGRRADWISAAEEVRRLGIKSERGGKVNAETMRRTWANVDKNAKALDWTGNQQQQTVQTKAPVESALARQVARPSATQTYSDLEPPPGDDDPPQIVLKTVTKPQ